MLRSALLIFLLSSFNLTAIADEPRKVTLTFLPQSSIEIKGRSNISAFNFMQDKALYQTEVNVAATINRAPQLLSEITLNIPLAKFRCNNPLMLNDFLEVTRSKEYPNVVITVQHIEVDHFSEIKNKSNFSGNALITITLTNKSKNYLIAFKGTFIDQILSLYSIAEITFNDFNLDPPTKFGGLIKVKEKLIIDLKLHLKIADIPKPIQPQLLSVKELKQ